ncbi:hypothetical protein QTP88_022177 [Uroleucon formosanum]
MGDLGDCPGRQTENYFYLIYLLKRINNLYNLKYSFSLSNVVLIEDQKMHLQLSHFIAESSKAADAGTRN